MQAHRVGDYRLPGGLEIRELGKGFGHEKSSTGASDRCHHRCHCLGDGITSRGVARRLAPPFPHGRTHCWDGGRWNIGRRPRPWPRLLLPRTVRGLLWPLVLYGVFIRSVIASGSGSDPRSVKTRCCWTDDNTRERRQGLPLRLGWSRLRGERLLIARQAIFCEWQRSRAIAEGTARNSSRCSA